MLVEKCRLDQLLGHGAMGQVWKARDLGPLGRDVAIKVMLNAYSNADLLHRFQREAVIASKLNHPAIMRLYDAHWYADQLFIVMEVLDGADLAKVIAATPRGMPVNTAVTLGFQLADGLSALHAADIVHRDLKPANIFVQAGDRLKICDLGLARDNNGSQHAHADSVVGTPLYIPPERWERSGPVEPSSDLYAMDCILYEMLTGRPPSWSGGRLSFAATSWRRRSRRAPVTPPCRQPSTISSSTSWPRNPAPGQLLPRPWSPS